MLSVSDSSAKQTFASSNSISLIPQVYAEWNYNTFSQPFITASSISNELVSTVSTLDLSLATNWSGPNVTAAQAVSAGKASAVRSSTNCINFTLQTDNAQITTSNKIILNGSATTGFYKMVFWVKSTALKTFDTPVSVTTAQLDPSSPSGSSTYYYRIVPVGSNGETKGLDLSVTPSDQFVFTGVSSSQVIFNITTSPTAAAYQIYRSGSSADNNPVYLGTIANTSSILLYTDNITSTVYNNFPPSNFTNKISFNPQIVFYNNTTVTYGTYFVKAFSNPEAESFIPQGTVLIDPVRWQKVEVWFGVKSELTSQAFDRIHLLFNASADYKNSSFYVDNIQVYSITEFDYLYNQQYPTDELFQSQRPGETLLNTNIASNDPQRYVNYGLWNQAIKPCSFAIQNPMLIMNSLYPFRQYVPSIYDSFKYYISQPGITTTGIQAQYDSYLSINKIVIKIVKGFAAPTSTSVILTTNVGDTTISSVIFSADGTAVIYYSGLSWSQTPWSSPPKLTDTGQIQSSFNNVKGIKLSVSGITIDSGILAADSAKYSNELNSIAVVEISPRLEVDLSPLITEISVTKELSQNKTGGFPIGEISSNNANITISNFPVTYGGSAFTIFDNTSPESTFYNLMRQGVKFTCSYISPLNSFTGKIPMGVFYSDTWNISDIDTVSINTFDQAKYIWMTFASPQYSATNAGLLEIITNILDISGFSDYNYDSLAKAIDPRTKISYFWCDETRTLFEVLSSLFVSYQMSAYFDEYGMLQFKSLGQILSEYSSGSFTSDFAITDTTFTPAGGTVSYIPNIIPSTFSESVGTKVGQIIMNYKTADANMSIDANGIGGDAGLLAIKRDVPAEVWKEDSDTALPCSYISRSMYPQDSSFYFDPSVLMDTARSMPNLYGEAFIGSEIVSWEGMEYIFFPINGSDISIRKVISVKGDIDKAISEIRSFLSVLGVNFKSIGYYPAGKLVGVKRGKYNTPVQNHLILDTQGLMIGTTSPSAYFNYYNISPNGAFSSATSGVTFSYGNAKVTQVVSGTTPIMTSTAISPKETSKNYNYYAFSFHASSKYAAQTNFGMYFNNKGTDSTVWYLTLSRSGVKGTKVSLGYGGPGLNPQNVTSEGQNSLAGIVGSKIDQTLSVDLFDNSEHRISLYVYSSYVYIYIDGRQVSRVKIYSNTANLSPNLTSTFGVFSQANKTGVASITFTEIYAAEFPTSTHMKKIAELKSFPRYHFNTESYLNNIVKGIPNIVNHYLWQSKPQIRGVKFYDVKLSKSPAIPGTSVIQKVFYGQAQSTNNGTNIILDRVNSWDVSYSPLSITPFRARFIAVNNSNQMVFLKAPGDKIGNLSTPWVAINSKYQFLSDAKVVTKTIDTKYKSNSIHLDTDWVQGENDVYRILNDSASLLTGFHSELSISIFGNPLIQIGDFCQLKYTLKRIGTASPVYYFVQSVTQTFSQGLTTSLVLKPMIIS